jgi:stalled ribosome rescue protein Dom34
MSSRALIPYRHHRGSQNLNPHLHVSETDANGRTMATPSFSEEFEMSHHYHVLVWIDHQQAKIFEFDATDVERSTVRSSHPHQHIHHKANSGDSGHAPVDKAFLKHVAEALSHAGAVLIAGPAGTKKELAAYIETNEPELAKRISGVETMDHPTDGALVAFARKFFRADDRMH